MNNLNTRQAVGRFALARIVRTGILIGIGIAAARAEPAAAPRQELKQSAPAPAPARQQAPKVDPALRFSRSANAIAEAMKARQADGIDSRSFGQRMQIALVTDDWKGFGEMFAQLSEKDSIQVYSRLIRDLSREWNDTMALSPEGYISLVNMNPKEKPDEQQIRQLGIILKVTLSRPFLVDPMLAAIKKGRLKGFGGAEQGGAQATPILLLAAGLPDEALEFLPDEAMAGDMIDAKKVRLHYDIVLKRYAESKDPRHLQLAWQDLKWIAKGKNLSEEERLKINDEMIRFLPRLPRSQAVDWLATRFREQPELRMELISRVGVGHAIDEIKKNRISVSDREQPLRLQILIANALLQTQGDQDRSINAGLTLLAGNWLREADHSMVVERDKAEKSKADYYNPKYYRYTGGPEALPFEVLYQTAPRGQWLEMISLNFQKRIEVTLALLTMRQEKAYEGEVRESILKIAESDPNEAGDLAEEFLNFWSRRHNPRLIKKAKTNKIGPKDMPIPLTSLTQRNNLLFLRDFARDLNERGVDMSQNQGLVLAFIQSHAVTEVFQPTDMEAVFGPLDKMSGTQIIALAKAMQERLAEYWRGEGIDEEYLATRPKEEVVKSVIDGYRMVAEMVDYACKEWPDNWTMQGFRGLLLHDQAQYAYSNNESREEFCKARDEAFDCFAKACWIYLLQLPDKPPADRSVKPFILWLNIILGSSDVGSLSVEPMPDLRGHTPESRLRDLRRLLESAAFIQELEEKKLPPEQLRAAVLKEYERAGEIDRAVWALRGRVADETTPLHKVTLEQLRALKLSDEEKSLLDDYEQLEARRQKSYLLNWHLEAVCKATTAVLPRIPPHLRHRTLAASLKLIDKAGWPEIPEGQMIRGMVEQYEEVLSELRLDVEIDGSDLIDPDKSFGIMIKLQFTEEVGASCGGFNRYLVNETTESLYAGQRYPGLILTDYRDNFEKRIRGAMEGDFLVEQISFEKTRKAVLNIPNTKPKKEQKVGERRWREQALAYVVLRPIDASVDWIPQVFMDMTFDDGSGKVVLPVPSQKVKINCKEGSGASPVRETSKLRLTQIVNAHQLAEKNGYVELRISADGRGLLPEIDEILDLEVPGFAKPVITEAADNLVSRFAMGDERFFAESHRNWAVKYRPDESLDRENPVFEFPEFSPEFQELTDKQRTREVRLEADRQKRLGVSEPQQSKLVESLFSPGMVLKVQHNTNYITVEDGMPVALNPEEIPETPGSPWRYVIIGLAALVVLGVLARLLVLAFRTRHKDDSGEQRHAIRMPGEINGFSILALLHAIANDSEVELPDEKRAALADEMRQIETANFTLGAKSSADDLAGIGRKWLKLAHRAR